MSILKCTLCGTEATDLQFTACPDCVNRLKLTDLFPEPLESPAYTKVLAERVRTGIGELCNLPDAKTLEHIITEALFLAALDLRRGHNIDLEYIGKFTMPQSADPWVTYIADLFILDPKAYYKALEAA